ncbi:SAM-dependent methyltransferase [Nocardia sp. NPDC051750]|uniref:SAM-dependent methyltransferase n=1 Tax=Nocardia sp. NPDC051750 TaxID=3364325 RepID=UPI0037971A26
MGLSLIALLNFVPGAYEITATLMAALPSGSYLAMTHLTGDFDPAGVAATVQVYRERGLYYEPRDQAGVTAFFEGMELLDPGVVPIHRWRAPDRTAAVDGRQGPRLRGGRPQALNRHAVAVVRRLRPSMQSRHPRPSRPD